MKLLTYNFPAGLALLRNKLSKSFKKWKAKRIAGKKYSDTLVNMYLDNKEARAQRKT